MALPARPVPALWGGGWWGGSSNSLELTGSSSAADRSEATSHCSGPSEAGEKFHEDHQASCVCVCVCVCGVHPGSRNSFCLTVTSFPPSDPRGQRSGALCCHLAPAQGSATSARQTAQNDCVQFQVLLFGKLSLKNSRGVSKNKCT